MTEPSDPSPAWRPYAHRRTVGWGDTDPARIAYTGRFADFMLEAIEGWYRDRLGTDWYRLNIDEGTGTPFVSLTLDFQSPVTPREDLDVEVRVAKVGRTSLSFAVRAFGAESRTQRFTGAATSVFVDAATLRPCPVPERYRGRIDEEQRRAAEDA